jgi:hypothetical protein
VIASFIGTFVGAILGQMKHEKSVDVKLHVGFGAILGRAIGVGFKMFIGFVILIASVIIVLS